MPDRKLRVFLCHASRDKPMVRELYQRLFTEDWIDPWLDEEKLLPGQDWDLEIEKAVEAADAVIVCLSHGSVTKEGYIQKEIRKVLDIALEKPEETIFIIPLRLDNCELPRRLRAWQYVDYFPAERQARTFQRLLESLRLRFSHLSPRQMSSDPTGEQAEDVGTDSSITEAAQVIAIPSKEEHRMNTGGFLLLLAFFVAEAITYLNHFSEFLDIARGILAALIGAFLTRRRQIPDSRFFKVALSIYLILYSIAHYLAQIGNEISTAWLLLAISSLSVGASLVNSVPRPGKRTTYSSLLIAAYLFLVAVEVALQSFGIYNSPIFILLMIISIVTSVLMWNDM